MSGAAAKNRRTGADMMVGAVELFRQEQEREKTAKEQAARIMELNAQLAEMEAKSKLELRAIEAQAEMEQQREQVERRNALLIEAYQMRLELHREMSTAELEQRVTAHRAVIEAEERQADTLKQLAGATIDTFGQQFAQMVAQVASGEVSMSEALSGFVRAILTQVGTMLISTGTAALVLQALSFIPGLWGITGPPGMGIGPAIAAIGVGTAMVAGASFISGGARANAGGGASARGATAPRGPSMGDVVPRGFAALAGASASPYVVNISFSGVVGDERRAARMIEDVLRRGR